VKKIKSLFSPFTLSLPLSWHNPSWQSLHYHTQFQASVLKPHLILQGPKPGSSLSLVIMYVISTSSEQRSQQASLAPNPTILSLHSGLRPRVCTLRRGSEPRDAAEAASPAWPPSRQPPGQLATHGRCP
jgi:hypothetical protein